MAKMTKEAKTAREAALLKQIEFQKNLLSDTDLGELTKPDLELINSRIDWNTEQIKNLKKK